MNSLAKMNISLALAISFICLGLCLPSDFQECELRFEGNGSSDRLRIKLEVRFKDQNDNLSFIRAFGEKHEFSAIELLPAIDNWVFKKEVAPECEEVYKDNVERSIYSDDYMHNQIQTIKFLKKPSEIEGMRLSYNDPKYVQQWSFGDHFPDHMNIQLAWAMGYIGKNVTICIVDTGVQHTHPELSNRFRPDLSMNIVDNNGRDVYEVHPLSNSETHGTACAGIAAAEANNTFCGVGVAHGAHIAVLRYLGSRMNEVREILALKFENQKIDIKSCSWGRRDDAESMLRMSEGVSDALEEAVTVGRQGRGVIFVWASGNGGESNDHAGADEFVNNVNVIAITSIHQSGQPVAYAEPGPSIWAATYVGMGKCVDGAIVVGLTVPSLNDSCADHFTGSSAAAPIASGIFALVLQSRPELSYRDIMHLIVVTARKANPTDPYWTRNGVGHLIHPYVGFGSLDAYAMIECASNWSLVPPRLQFNKFKVRKMDMSRLSKTLVRVETQILIPANQIKHTEHVSVQMSVFTLSHRGGIQINLISPANTKSELLGFRARDHSKQGIEAFTFTTNRCWGENPNGLWLMVVNIKGNNPTTEPDLRNITIHDFVVYGT